MQQSVKDFGDYCARREKYSIAFSFLTSKIYVPHIITNSRTFIFVGLQLFCQFHGQYCMVLQGGLFLLGLVDFYGVTFPVIILGTFEMIGIAWIYGT
jgi:hypothetical protein